MEIKGNKNFDGSKIKELFRQNGYEYVVKYEEDINLCLDFLMNKLDIDSILVDIKNGDSSNEYYEYTFIG